MTALILPFEEHRPHIADDAFLAPNATIIGDVEIGARAGIWYGCVLRGDVHAIRVGARTNIQDGTVVHVSDGRFGTEIGDDVTIGHSALVHGCVLEPGSFVGMKATVMDGCVVETGAMVAAGALLTPGKRVLRGQLWAGNPARHLRDLRPEEVEHFARTISHYAELGARHRRSIDGADRLRAVGR